jgi:hypothetical protein
MEPKGTSQPSTEPNKSSPQPQMIYEKEISYLNVKMLSSFGMSREDYALLITCQIKTSYVQHKSSMFSRI